MIEYLKKFALTHVAWLVIFAVAFVAFHSWQSEHDARLLADQQQKISEARVSDLQAQIAAVNAAAQKQIQVVTKVVHDVQTPTQAVAALPQISDVPLNARVATDSPTQVSVDALPLVQALGECKADAITLNACQTEVKADQQIIAEKQTEIVALKKPKSFWRRVSGTLKAVGVGVGIGLVLGAHGL